MMIKKSLLILETEKEQGIDTKLEKTSPRAENDVSNIL